MDTRSLRAENHGGTSSAVPLRRCFVAGAWRESPLTFTKSSPVDGSVVAQVVEADRQMVDEAVAAARRAAPAWAATPQSQRRALLHAVADEIDRRFEEFVEAEVRDTGRPVTQARTLDIPRGAANFRFFADLVQHASGEFFETETPDGAGAINYTLRKPHGVVAVVSPWNLPFLLLTWKVAPALILGNCVVAKPSEETPSTATLLAEVFEAVGAPAGVFNLIHGHGEAAAGEFLTKHADVDAITFTGETRTGEAIMRAAASGVRPISFELGGKNAAIVFADCDLENALDGVARSTFLNCGQVCLCTERIYVERPLFDRFVAGLKERAERLVPGEAGGAVDCTLGPLISREHRDKVLNYYRLARDEGANVVTGGDVPRFGDSRDEGCWIQPTLFTGLPQDSRILQEEIFGPVAHVAPFDTEEEALALANDSRYGLAAAVWTGSLTRAHRFSRALHVGTAWVNTWFLRDLRAPFGGVSLSGIGREGGMHSLAFYGEPINICVKL
jgi:aminomuconate-semialdehyde/2-hydroxymuconate-6-semialdehyde dehydrogenase